MTQYETLNVKLSNPQINKLKSRIKSGAEVTWNIWSNVISDSSNGTNFSHKLLLTGHKFRGFVNLSRIIHQLI